MIKKLINQNDIINSELIGSYGIEDNFSSKSINRIKTKPEVVDKSELLENLKKKIQNINNCKLKINAKKVVFGDGNPDSPVMLIGEGPGEKEDEIGRPFVGDAGKLLDKMLNAINLNRDKIYITNVVNYRPPNNRKPESNEIKTYAHFLKDHISIVDPKLLILMGSTAVEALLGPKIKISKERGNWKEIILKQKTYLTIGTFHPAYLLRLPDQKKYSWIDLKEIRKKINELNLNI